VKQHIQSKGTLGPEYPDAIYLWEGDTPTFLHLFPNGLSDPDGDPIASHWMIYPEAGTWVDEATLSRHEGAHTQLAIPQPGPGSPANPTIHVILTVRDNGTPPLTAYRRGSHIIAVLPGILSPMYRVDLTGRRSPAIVQPATVAGIDHCSVQLSLGCQTRCGRSSG